MSNFPSTRAYRAMFYVRLTDHDIEPVDLRLLLRKNGQPLTETRIYQWIPPDSRERLAALQ